MNRVPSSLADQSCAQRVYFLLTCAESADDEAHRPGNECVRFSFWQMEEAVARPDLERHVVIALPLPRKTRATEHEEDLLVALRVKRRRALAGLDSDPVHPNPFCAGGAREGSPVAADRAGLVVLGLDIVPVDDVIGHPPIRPWGRPQRRAPLCSAPAPRPRPPSRPAR